MTNVSISSMASQSRPFTWVRRKPLGIGRAGCSNHNNGLNLFPSSVASWILGTVSLCFWFLVTRVWVLHFICCRRLTGSEDKCNQEREAQAGISISGSNGHMVSRLNLWDFNFLSDTVLFPTIANKYVVQFNAWEPKRGTLLATSAQIG